MKKIVFSLVMIILGFKQSYAWEYNEYLCGGNSMCYSEDSCDQETGYCDDCADNGYGHNENGVCVRCEDSNCEDCEDNYKQCDGCYDDMITVNGRCEEEADSDTCPENCSACGVSGNCAWCDSGYYMENGVCKQNPENCSWYNVNEGKCGGCNSGYYVENGNCKQNPEGCSWYNATTGKCTGCTSGYILINGECSLELDRDKCQDNCTSCGINGKCAKCVEGYGLDENNNCKKCSNKNCSDCNTNYRICNQCQYPGYGKNENGECVKCAIDGCNFCTANYKSCTQCKTGLGIKNSEGNKECIACADSNCSDCGGSNYTSCRTCKTGFRLVNGSCQACAIENCSNCTSDVNICSSCQTGYGKNENGECIKCAIDGCLTCYSNYARCENCQEGYGGSGSGNCFVCDDDNCAHCANNGNRCIECKDGYAPNDNGTCQPIEIEHCYRMNTLYGQDTVCQRCEKGYKNTGYECIPSDQPCPEGYDDDIGNSMCRPKNCNASYGVCFGCKNNTYMREGKCVEECEEGETKKIVYEKGMCVPKNCLLNNYGECYRCQKGFYVQQGKCVSECDDGYLIGTNNKGYPSCFPADLGCGYGEKQVGDECVAREDGEGCDVGFYLKDNLCVSESKGCGDGYLGKDGVCISSANGCGAGYKDMGGFCNRIQYTPAEAAPLLNDDNNFVILTFKK